MLLSIIDPVSYATDQLTHAHHNVNGQALYVSYKTGNLIRHKAYALDQSVFTYINRFTGQLSAARQNKIMEIHLEFQRLFDRMETTEDFIDNEFRDLCTQLAAQYPINEIYDWITSSGRMIWPSDKETPSTYENVGSQRFPHEMTYLREDYRNLVALIIQLRAFTPIMAHYFDVAINKRTVSRFWIDVIRLRFLANSAIFDGPGWQKLTEYINAIIKTNPKAVKAVVLETMSEQDFPEWLLANVVMRKILVQPIRSQDPSDTTALVVRHIHCHIGEQLKRTERDSNAPSFSGEKLSTADNEQTLSRFETVRSRDILPKGDVVFIKHMMRDPIALAKQLEPDIEVKVLQQFLGKMNFGEFMPTNAQVTLGQWVLAPGVSPATEPYIPLINWNQNLCVAAAVLWHRGHKELAMYITAINYGQKRDDVIALQGNQHSKHRYYKQLEDLYPYVVKGKATDKGSKVVIEAIQLVNTEFQSNSWIANLPKQLEPELLYCITNTGAHKFINKNQELLEFLYKLVIDIAARPMVCDPWERADQIAKELGLM